MIVFRVNYLKHRNSSIIHIAIAPILTVFIATLTTLLYLIDGRLHFNLVMVTCYVISITYSYAITFQFISAAICCRDRLQAINRRILIKNHQSSLEIRNCVALYRKIFLIIQEINRTLTMPFILIFTYHFVIITFEIFAVVRVFYKNSDIKFLVSLNVSLWSIIEIYPIFTSIYVATSTIEEVENIKKIGYEILCTRRIFDPQTEKIFGYFLKSIEKSKLQLKTIFFNLDWTLFFQASSIHKTISNILTNNFF